MTSIDTLRWKKYPVLNDGFICLVDAMGDDSSIVQAARVSYGKDERESIYSRAKENCAACGGSGQLEDTEDRVYDCYCTNTVSDKDRSLIRYLLNHSHTTPFEMIELKFLVRVPMDCWRQWIRHRTANVNEYSTRYTEAIDSQQTTSPQEWRLQATDNKQGSSGFLEITGPEEAGMSTGEALSADEKEFHEQAWRTYQWRLKAGVAKEQARKDLPLSTYTEAYWKCDLHNIFNFLRLRMDSHAQYEIRMYANAMYEIVKQVVPVACEAFEDYVLHAKKFSRMEISMLKEIIHINDFDKPSSITKREWKEFLGKLS